MGSSKSNPKCPEGKAAGNVRMSNNEHLASLMAKNLVDIP